MSICNALTSGLSKGCENNIGGIKKLYLLEWDYVSSVTHNSPTDDITAITTLGARDFYEFEFNKNTSTFSEKTTMDQAVGSEVCIQTITLILNRREQAKRDKLLLLGKFKDLMAIVKDSNGKYWLVGEVNGINLTEKSSENGTVKTDRNGYTLTFVGEESEDACEISQAAVDSVTA